jgi:hypothetical protein
MAFEFNSIGRRPHLMYHALFWILLNVGNDGLLPSSFLAYLTNLASLCVNPAVSSSEYCSKFALPPLLEMLIIALLAVWWLIAAIAASLAKINPEIVDVTSSARKFFRGGSWILTALFIISTVIAWCVARDEDTARQDQFVHQSQQHQPEEFPGYV